MVIERNYAVSARVAVVVVTYGDRWERSGRIAAERARRAGAEWVIVVNNSVTSMDGRVSLAGSGVGSVLVVENGRNLGSAAGVSNGLIAALDLPCDLVWLLDDDNFVDDDTLWTQMQLLERRSREFAGGLVVVTPFRTEDAAQRRPTADQIARLARSRPRGSFMGFDIVQFVRRKAFGAMRGFWWNRSRDEIYGAVEVTMAPYGGLLVPRAVLAKVGLPDRKYVLYGDDLDWTRRMSALGVRISYCPDARVVEEPKAFAGGSWIERGALAAASAGGYYRIRSMSHVSKSVADSVPARVRFRVNQIAWISCAIFFLARASALGDVPALLRALRDGERGDFSWRPELAG